MRRPVTFLAMSPGLPAKLFTRASRARLSAVTVVDMDHVLTEFDSPSARRLLGEAEVLLTGWGCPPINAEVLAAAPALRAIAHAAGTVKGHVGRVCWDRGIVVSSAAEANSIPAAEYTLAVVLLALKGAPWISRSYSTRQDAMDLVEEYPRIGTYGRTVGIVGASRVGRRVIELLRPFDVDVIVTDPYLTAEAAAQLGVRSVSLDDLLRSSDIVSLHAPAVPSTRNMLDRSRLALIRDGATLVNTARGSLVDQDALVDELSSGRINGVLDVTEPEVLPKGSPLYTL